MRGVTRDSVVRIPWRPSVVGTGAGRIACYRIIRAGWDQVMAATVVYGLAEGFSRGLGHPPANPMRFHDGLGRTSGMGLPEGLCEDHLVETARATLDEPGLFEGRTIGEIEEICLEIGKAMRADAVRRTAW